MVPHHKILAAEDVADAFIQAADDRVGLLAAGLYLQARTPIVPSAQDVSAFRYRAEAMLRTEPMAQAQAAPAVAPASGSFWTGGDAGMAKARLKAALSLLGLVIVMAILFRMAGSWLFGPVR